MENRSFKLEIREENLSTMLLTGQKNEIKTFIKKLISQNNILSSRSKKDILSWYLANKRFVEALDVYDSLSLEDRKEFSEMKWEIIKGINEKD